MTKFSVIALFELRDQQNNNLFVTVTLTKMTKEKIESVFFVHQNTKYKRAATSRFSIITRTVLVIKYGFLKKLSL